MPTRTGISHALSAVLVLLLSPFIQRFVDVFLTEYDLMLALDAFAQAIANDPAVPYSTDTVSTVVFFGTVSLITFLWGVAYHLNRHGLRQ